VLQNVSRSDYNAVLYIMQCRAPPHVAIVVWRGFTTTLLVGGMGKIYQQYDELGASLFPYNVSLYFWPQENSTI